jgi:hypothetical protein
MTRWLLSGSVNTQRRPKEVIPAASTGLILPAITCSWCGRRDERCEGQGQSGEVISCRLGAGGLPTLPMGKRLAPVQKARRPGRFLRLIFKYSRREGVPGPHHPCGGVGRIGAGDDPGRDGGRGTVAAKLRLCACPNARRVLLGGRETAFAYTDLHVSADQTPPAVIPAKAGIQRSGRASDATSCGG